MMRALFDCYFYKGTDNINNDKGIDDISKGKGTDDINKDKDGILLFSVSSRVNIMRLLLIQNESDVNAKKTVDTLLHTAAKNGHMDSVELLVDERGADVNNEDGVDIFLRYLFFYFFWQL
eukprot:GHVR01035149.1.p1 GENE.GHVR01035149.1~~GHVR01035149.1.p1  ORF type:complete len:120 (-),score=26.33 GHVR01035149.1:829-1188(-)